MFTVVAILALACVEPWLLWANPSRQARLSRLIRSLTRAHLPAHANPLGCLVKRAHESDRRPSVLREVRLERLDVSGGQDLDCLESALVAVEIVGLDWNRRRWASAASSGPTRPKDGRAVNAGMPSGRSGRVEHAFGGEGTPPRRGGIEQR